MDKTVFHIEFLKDELTRRRELNPSYSMRSFSKFLGLQPPVLSTVLNYKRKLPLNHAKRISDLLRLDEEMHQLFMSSVYQEKLGTESEESFEPAPSFNLNQQKHFNVIADWKYFALLNLLELKDTIHNYKHLASRLGVKEAEVKTIIQELIDLELLMECNSGKWIRTKKSLKTPEDVLSFALQMSHRNDLKKAVRMLDNVSIDKRDYSSVTFKCNPQKLPKMKDAIRDFRDKLCAIAEDGEEKEVYQMSLQLFPLTDSEL